MKKISFEIIRHHITDTTQFSFRRTATYVKEVPLMFGVCTTKFSTILEESEKGLPFREIIRENMDDIQHLLGEKVQKEIEEYAQTIKEDENATVKCKLQGMEDIPFISHKYRQLNDDILEFVIQIPYLICIVQQK